MPEPSSRIIEGPPLERPIPPVTVPQFISQRTRELAGETALIDAPSGRRLSYGELDRLIARCAAGLVAHGFAPGDRLLNFLPNGPEWLVAALGAMRAGGVVSGANSLYGAAELARQLHDVEARFILTIPALLPTVREATAGLPAPTIITVEEAPGTLSFASMLAGGDFEPAIMVAPDGLAALPYSSGTSGRPKGVMLNHRNLVSNLIQIDQAIATPEYRVWLAYLPMFHIYGFTFSLFGLAIGAALVILPRFEPESFLEAIQAHRVTHLSVVPPVLQFLAMHPLIDSYDLSSLRHIGCGAAPLGSALEQRARERLKCEVIQGFGMTESSAVVAVTRLGRHRPGSCGELVPGTQARIADPATLADVERGASGELWFRGPQAFQGYLNDPSATSEAITPDGWVRTGDIGYFDRDGYLFITDRLKELIKVKGFQVAPAELEALLLTHPSVADAAVIGRPDERAGEVPVAYVVARGTIDSQGLKDWFAGRVIGYKRLGEVIVCESIPKSPTGKILRRVLRAQDLKRR
ncbi:MAG TPA: AMP-binding protein [Steroidobacteraceae bacterium]|nr:AMP-binding protein [Steroidobacteraceae bacterium]